jgi:DNA-binding response OmpR family regulator
MPDRGSSPHASDRAKRRRRAAERLAHAARVLVCECRDDGTTPFHAAVRALGFEALPCSSLADALREAARTPFDVVVTVMPKVTLEQASLLQLLRRGLASTPLVIVSEDSSLEARSRCQPARPYFFAVPPIPEAELRAILSGAVEAAQRG